MVTGQRDILDHIGRTPLVPLSRLARGLPVPVLAKCEHMNPGGSVKDRIAKAIVDDAEARGVLRAGMTLIEATAGNTGVLEQTNGRVGAFVAGAGTGGTLTGVGRRLKAALPTVRIVLADPIGSALADWVETGRLGPDGTYAVEGIGASEVAARGGLDGPVVTVLPDGWARYRAKLWMQEWA